ncbi:hypothetical protein B7494_g2361 [Chlorociboria aeruginascens]|nr:hypothetical protein B7494_g2361 [Chlorociboria aeruginascens]
MIRMPPTAIGLTSRDLGDFEERRKQRQIDEELFKSKSGIENVRQYETPAEDVLEYQQTTKISLKSIDGIDAIVIQDRQFANDTSGSSDSSEPNVPTITALPDDTESKITIKCEDTPENPNLPLRQNSPRSKDDFHYGGFIQSPDPIPRENTSYRSPSFAPDDVSTPQHLHPNEELRRGRPIRSPLLLSSNTYDSPESRSTYSVTPRVTSRVASHNTPGIIFSRPARRRPQQSVVTFRHQTNSFSFDTSERASAAYELDRVSSVSTINSRPRSSEIVSLHEELRGSSLQSLDTPFRARSAAPSPSPGPVEIPEDGNTSFFSAPETQDNLETQIQNSEEPNISQRATSLGCPQLSLPPPFSTTPRSSSRAESLPSGLNDPAIQSTSSTNREPSVSPTKGIVEGEDSTLLQEETDNAKLSPQSIVGRSASGILRVAERLFSSYRARSPLGRASSPVHSSLSTSATSTPRQLPYRLSSREKAPPSTPSRSYQVYNDAVSPESQPQTPANLPEARHQSRYHSSYTAPITRAGTRMAAIFSSGGIRLEGPLEEALHHPVYWKKASWDFMVEEKMGTKNKIGLMVYDQSLG